MDGLINRLNIIEQKLNVNPDLPQPTSGTGTIYLNGNGNHTTIGDFDLCEDGNCAQRFQSDNSLEEARYGYGAESLHNSSDGRDSISIFYYNYTVLGMSLSAEDLYDRINHNGPRGVYITGVDLFINKDPGSYGTNVNVYASEGDTVPSYDENLDNLLVGS